MVNEDRDASRALVALLTVSLVGLAVRALLAATRVGFGDSEALYASYALHPQPAYLDHPGLVGVVARVVGGGLAPSPLAAHRFTAIAATAWPWLMALACRAVGAGWSRALTAGLVAALVPEMAVGLFALTPDLLLAFAWTAAMGLAAFALQAKPGSTRATAAFAAAGVLAGVAASAKVTGFALPVALAVAYASRPARPYTRTFAPWAGLAAGLIVVVPVVMFEAHFGWPLLRHRLIDTQASAGISLRNVGALLGGQLVYLSPLVVVMAVYAARAAWRGRYDAVGQLLLAFIIVPLVPLALVCVWSRVAEPHWIAPALLALVPAAARSSGPPSRRLTAWTCATAGLFAAAAHAWALVPEAIRLTPANADPRYDVTNELYGWRSVADVVRDEATLAATPGAPRDELSVVGPHWVLCAQVEAALEGAWPVGCATPIRDDFDGWWPRPRWRNADTVIWVSDARFETDPEAPSYTPLFGTHVPVRSRKIRVFRDGRTVRIFTVTVLSRRGGA